ncbi:MAG: hypothetical protein AAB401_20930, partial [Acidobacteriota bacterium]
MRPLGLCLVVMIASCHGNDPIKTNDGGIPSPPSAYLSFDEPLVIGTQVTGKVNIEGCKSVRQVRIIHNGAFLADTNYQSNPNEFVLDTSLFTPLWNSLGIAASLNLVAQVECDDGRIGDSLSASVKFFPVAEVVSVKGFSAAPDSFVAEGGANGVETTFIGCAQTATGTALVRSNVRGEIVDYNENIKLNCSFASQISERVTANGIRWLLEPNKGVVAFNSDLDVTTYFVGKVQRLVVDPRGNGDAIIVIDLQPQDEIRRIRFNATNDSDRFVWALKSDGIFNGNPLVDVGSNVVWVPNWQYGDFGVGNNLGKFLAFKVNYLTGQIVNADSIGQVTPVFVQQYGPSANQPIVPEVALTSDGTNLLMPLMSGTDVTSNTTVVKCPTAVVIKECLNDVVGRASPTFDGIFSLELHFVGGKYIDADGP